MTGTPIFVGPREKKLLTELREFANKKENWINLEEVIKGKRPQAGDRKRHVVKIPSGMSTRTWRVVYSVDLDDQLGPVKHLSVTLAGAPGRVPGPIGMQFIAEPLGLNTPYDYIGPQLHGADDAIHIYLAITPEGKDAMKALPKLEGYSR